MMNFNALKSGDKVAITAPSRWTTPVIADLLKNYLERNELEVVLGDNLFNFNRFSAGTDLDRAKEINFFFSQKDIKAIFAIHGGYGSVRILPLLDFSLIKENPKILIGFSDISGLILGLNAKTGLHSIYGFSAKDLYKTGNPSNNIHQSLWKLLRKETFEITGFDVFKHGIVEAQIIGGCLSLLISLIGTPFFPNLEGKILILEDIREEPYKIDRMLNQLYQIGAFEKIQALIFGKFVECRSQHSYYGTISEVIHEWGLKINKPCIYNFPLGHNADRFPIIVGKSVILNTKEKRLVIDFNSPP